MSIVVLVPSGEVKEIPFEMLNNLIIRDFHDEESLNIKWDTIYSVFTIPDTKSDTLKKVMTDLKD